MIVAGSASPLLLASAGGYNLTKSLRFRSSASAYLNRTPSTAGNRKTWTWSAWVKRGTISAASNMNLWAAGSSGADEMYFQINTSDQLRLSDNTYNYFVTSQVFRDPSAWYHIVLAFDSTQATGSNRIKLYINGVQVTAFATNNISSITLNGDYAYQNTVAQTIGRQAPSASGYYDGYTAEINNIDGQALTPSSFGETSTSTGVWIPKKYTGTYGTNGFYLPFTDTTSTSTLGTDFSGNSNTWTVNNISLTSGSTYDSMNDVPTLTSATASNFAVLNPLNKSTVGSSTPSNGNLNVLLDRSSNNPWIQSTIAFPSSGKWYLEYSQTSINVTSTPYNMIGVMDVTTPISTDVASVTGVRGYYLWNGNKRSGTTVSSYGSGTALNDIIGVAVDMDSGKIWFAVNNTWVNSGSPTGGTNAAFTDLTGTTWSFFNSILGETTSNSWVNFGQRPFAYTPPTGFVALNTYNLPTPTIGATASTTANKYMDVNTYTGTNATQSIVNSGGMQPDLVWIKTRSAISRNTIFDAVRGTNKVLWSDSTDAEGTANAGTGLTAFASNGFTLGTQIAGTSGSTNGNTDTLVAWQWRASNTTAVTNTAGSITSTVSANTTAGFSIVTWTGSGSTATIGHGLGVTPSMIIWFHRTNASAYSHITYHASLPSAAFVIYLNLTIAQSNDNNAFNSTAPTSTVFTVGGYNSADTMVAYCFAPVAGYSAFGSYTGNGSTDGPFIFTGFRPRFIMMKASSAARGWIMFDTARDPYNVAQYRLFANTSDAESSGTTANNMDILSNGFKLRLGTNSEPSNENGTTYIYMAFAESPFKYANAR